MCNTSVLLIFYSVFLFHTLKEVPVPEPCGVQAGGGG